MDRRELEEDEEVVRIVAFSAGLKNNPRAPSPVSENIYIYLNTENNYSEYLSTIRSAFGNHFFFFMVYLRMCALLCFRVSHVFFQVKRATFNAVFFFHVFINPS